MNPSDHVYDLSDMSADDATELRAVIDADDPEWTHEQLSDNRAELQAEIDSHYGEGIVTVGLSPDDFPEIDDDNDWGEYNASTLSPDDWPDTDYMFAVDYE